MLAHKGFIIYIISVPYDFIVFLICLSLSFIVLQFLLCLIYSSQVIYSAYQAARATSIHKYSSSPFPKSSLMSFRISISFYYFQLLSFGCCGWVALYQVCYSVTFFCVSTHLQVYCDPPRSRRLSGCGAYIGSRAFYAVDLIGSGYFFIK